MNVLYKIQYQRKLVLLEIKFSNLGNGDNETTFGNHFTWGGGEGRLPRVFGLTWASNSRPHIRQHPQLKSVRWTVLLEILYPIWDSGDKITIFRILIKKDVRMNVSPDAGGKKKKKKEKWFLPLSIWMIKREKEIYKQLSVLQNSGKWQNSEMTSDSAELGILKLNYSKSTVNQSINQSIKQSINLSHSTDLSILSAL